MIYFVFIDMNQRTPNFNTDLHIYMLCAFCCWFFVCLFVFLDKNQRIPKGPLTHTTYRYVFHTFSKRRQIPSTSNLAKKNGGWLTYQVRCTKNDRSRDWPIRQQSVRCDPYRKRKCCTGPESRFQMVYQVRIHFFGVNNGAWTSTNKYAAWIVSWSFCCTLWNTFLFFLTNKTIELTEKHAIFSKIIFALVFCRGWKSKTAPEAS